MQAGMSSFSDSFLAVLDKFEEDMEAKKKELDSYKGEFEKYKNSVEQSFKNQIDNVKKEAKTEIDEKIASSKKEIEDKSQTIIIKIDEFERDKLTSLQTEMKGMYEAFEKLQSKMRGFGKLLTELNIRPNKA